MNKIHLKTKSADDSLQELLERPDFQNAVDTLRTKWKVDIGTEIQLFDSEQISAKKNKLLNSKKFINDLKLLQQNFNLDERYSTFIEDYVFLDLFVNHQITNISLEKRTGRDGDSITGEPVYIVRIYPETTQADFIHSWIKINTLIHGSGVKPNRKKFSKNFFRDRKIYQLAQLGYCVEDIHNFFVNKFSEEIDYPAIINAESKYRKKFGIKNSSKLGYRKNGKTITPLQVVAANYNNG